MPEFGAQEAYEFDKKVIVITGASSGIGKAAAKAFYDRGASLVINSRTEARIAAAAREIDPSGSRVVYEVGDIRNLSVARRIAERAEHQFGRVDILINNAGVFRSMPFLDHTEEDFFLNLEVIVKGTFFLSQFVVPIMQKAGGGSIVNLGSLWGIRAVKREPSAAHSAAKAAVHGLTQALALELATYNIRVNAVAPSYVDKIPPFPPEHCSFHPLQRRGEPRDVVESILFLASERANWLTGVVLPVDGGVSAGH